MLFHVEVIVASRLDLSEFGNKRVYKHDIALELRLENGLCKGFADDAMLDALVVTKLYRISNTFAMQRPKASRGALSLKAPNSSAGRLASPCCVIT